MKAVDVMVRDVVTVKPDDEVADAVRLLAEHDVSALLWSTTMRMSLV